VAQETDGSSRSTEHALLTGPCAKEVAVLNARRRPYPVKSAIQSTDGVGVQRSTVRRFPRVNAGMVAARTRGMLPELIELPLDDAIERLSVEVKQSKVNKLAKHTAERWLSLRHNLNSSAYLS